MFSNPKLVDERVSVDLMIRCIFNIAILTAHSWCASISACRGCWHSFAIAVCCHSFQLAICGSMHSGDNVPILVGIMWTSACNHGERRVQGLLGTSHVYILSITTKDISKYLSCPNVKIWNVCGIVWSFMDLFTQNSQNIVITLATVCRCFEQLNCSYSTFNHQSVLIRKQLSHF